MGYCGSGVSMASYLGMRAGQKVLGLKDGQTAFDGLPFPTRPLYTGTALVPAAGRGLVPLARPGATRKGQAQSGRA